MANESLAKKKVLSKFCSVEGCERKSSARTYCTMHYHRWQRYGDPTIVKGSNGVIGETPEERFWAQVDKNAPNGCWEWRGSVNSVWGYGRYLFKGTVRKPHRLAWFLIKGEWPQMMLLHSCDNRICVNPDHLREGTQKENVGDAVERNRNPKGETHGQAKVTEEDVKEIRQRYQRYNRKGGDTQASLAREFGVSQSVISKIILRESWKHV